jgi:hypothetical protein
VLSPRRIISPESHARICAPRGYSQSQPQSPSIVNSSTIQDKVLAGYQGWGGARSTWDHWSKDGQVPSPKAGNEHFEMVPQMGEYPKAALHDTDFRYNGNGSVVSLYDNTADGVVDLHFSWMKEYASRDSFKHA